jgi:cell division protease FtsH
MSGAELANLINEAALFAVRRHAEEIDAGDLDAARDRVLLGLRRSSLVLSPDEKRTVAYHEAGHALLAAVLPYADPVHKVTILPTGMALGATQQLPTEEHQIRRRPELDDALAVLLAGPAAEELVFGVASTGGHDDLVTATDLARHMVREWGMSDRLGHIAWGAQGPVFLGEDLIHTRDYSDETAHVIDEETTRVLDEQASRAARELAGRRAQLDALAAALLDHETLESADITAILASFGPSRRAAAS